MSHSTYFTIRTSCDDDIPTILSVIKAAFIAHRGKVNPPSSAEHKSVEIVREELLTANAYVAEVADEMVGCVFCEPQGDALYVSRLAIIPAHQGRGIAFALMQKTEEVAQASDLRGIILSVRIELVHLHQYYQQLGFHVTGYGMHDGFDVPTFVKMRKELHSEAGGYTHVDTQYVDTEGSV